MSDDPRHLVKSFRGRPGPLSEAPGAGVELPGVRAGLVSLHVDTSGCTGCASPGEVPESGPERLILEKLPGVTGLSLPRPAREDA
jgi:hypothetical protein